MPLNETEVTHIQRAGEHFKKVLREVFDVLPYSARTIAGLARWSEVNKSTCQRLVQALTKTQNGIDVIMTLPGIGGLEQLHHSFFERLGESKALQNFAQMTVQYHDLIAKFASSQSDLKKQLGKYQTQTSGTLETYARMIRKNAYESNRELTGESADTYIGVHFTRIHPKSHSFLDELIIAHKSGVELSHSARPFAQSFVGNQSEITLYEPKLIERVSQSAIDLHQSGEYLLAEFSTEGIEKTFSGVGNLNNTLVYDHTLPPINGRRFDITTAHFEPKTQRNPLVDDNNVICQSVIQRSPAKKLILVAFLQRELAQQGRVQSGCYPISVKVLEKLHRPEDLWSERFFESLEISLIDPEDMSSISKFGLPQLSPLVEAGFQMLGDEKSKYTGYLISVEYPVWLTSYRFYFVF